MKSTVSLACENKSSDDCIPLVKQLKFLPYYKDKTVFIVKVNREKQDQYFTISLPTTTVCYVFAQIFSFLYIYVITHTHIYTYPNIFYLLADIFL